MYYQYTYKKKKDKMFPIAFPINRDNDDVLLLIEGINIVKWHLQK